MDDLGAKILSNLNAAFSRDPDMCVLAFVENKPHLNREGQSVTWFSGTPLALALSLTD